MKAENDGLPLVATAVGLPVNDVQALAVEARRQGISRNQLVRDFVRRGLVAAEKPTKPRAAKAEARA